VYLRDPGQPNGDSAPGYSLACGGLNRGSTTTARCGGSEEPEGAVRLPDLHPAPLSLYDPYSGDDRFVRRGAGVVRRPGDDELEMWTRAHLEEPPGGTCYFYDGLGRWVWLSELDQSLAEKVQAKLPWAHEQTFG